MHDIPPLSSRAREFLDLERDLPSVPPNRRDRAVARARSAALANEVSVPLRSFWPASRMRWAVAAVLAGTAAVASATMLEWRGRSSSGGPSPARATWSARDSAGVRAAAVSPPAAPPGGPPPVPGVAESPGELATTGGPGPAATANRSAPRAALSDELRWLAPARQALARRDFGAALTAIAEHARRFREGRLVEEREALRVKALAGLGRVNEARAAAGEFRRRFPRSALLPAIAGSLAAE